MKNQKIPFLNSLSIITTALLILAAGTSCDMPKRFAVGIEDEIIVIADSAEYYELEAELLGVFGKLIKTPQDEALFSIRRKDYIDLESIENRKNIIILAPLNTNSYPSQFIQSEPEGLLGEFIITALVFTPMAVSRTSSLGINCSFVGRTLVTPP